MINDSHSRTYPFFGMLVWSFVRKLWIRNYARLRWEKASYVVSLLLISSYTQAMAQKLWFECSGEHRDLRRGGSENSDKTTVETMHLYIDLDRKVKYFYRINDGKFYDQAGIVSVEEDVKWHEEKGIADGSINRRSLVLEQSSHLYVGDMLYENYYSMQCKIVSAPSAPARQF